MDPYFLNFLGLSDAYSEKDLESSIIAELQKFIIELGSDFAFMARQKRIVVDDRDYYIDLLFMHRRLKCLVAIELKLGEFEAGYKGQMELYLRYLEKYEQVEGENPLAPTRILRSESKQNSLIPYPASLSLICISFLCKMIFPQKSGHPVKQL